MQKALASVVEKEGDVKVHLEYKPFLVDPSLPVDKCVGWQERMKSRFGKQRAEQIEKTVKSRGEQLGLDFNFTGPIRSPLAAHRLIMHAYDIGGGEAQHALLAEIQSRVLECRQDVGCPDVLSSCAAKAGVMSKESARQFLASPVLSDRVHDEILIARVERGVSGVPFTVIDDKWAVSGGQTAEVYEEIFLKVLRNEVMTARDAD
jgi:predicted DsbA family dithiol-disulfide isomerase